LAAVRGERAQEGAAQAPAAFGGPTGSSFIPGLRLHEPASDFGFMASQKLHAALRSDSDRPSAFNFAKHAARSHALTDVICDAAACAIAPTMGPVVRKFSWLVYLIGSEFFLCIGTSYASPVSRQGF
jgi:hypothetical protein